MSAPRDELKDEGARPAGPVTAGDPPPPATAQEGVPPTAPPTGDSAEQDDGSREVEKDFEKLLADAEQQKEEYLELARRTKADFENFRKRAAAQTQEAQVRGKVEVAREVIDAVDNLERALEAADDGAALRDGVEMVLSGLRETLTRNGIEVVDPKGEKFDPNQHEALSTMPVEGSESGVVVEVVQKGYALGDQLVRPARVVVSA
ncbi:MAG TPA: nucleotide exchange factor GrpE [Solirubrobacterales bacterium]|jgi:molecular chaperone GrpE|nr:nucleotide exchange factor GrpE [Solirubrobacterales bacterium]